MNTSNPEPVVYRNPQAPIEQRIQDLLSRMTIEEKAAQLCCRWSTKHLLYDENYNFSPGKALDILPHGIGQIARPSDIRGVTLWDRAPFRSIENTVEFVNDLQRFLIEKTRLGIPALFHEELAHGLLAGEATIFPIPLGIASTWDLGLGPVNTTLVPTR
jgi:beta-glucosidase